MQRLSSAGTGSAYQLGGVGTDSIRQMIGGGAWLSQPVSREAARQPLTSSQTHERMPLVTHRSPRPTRSLSPLHAPVRIALKLQAFWNIDDPSFRAMCGLPEDSNKTTDQLLAELANLRDVKQRLRALVTIRKRLSAVLGGDRATELSWLAAPWPRLSEHSPLELLRRGKLEDVLAVEAAARELAGA